MSDAVYLLLAHCARAECNATHHRRIARAAGRLTVWGKALDQAKGHHMSPLLYTHLRAAGVSIPPGVKPELQSRSMHHLVANEVKMRVLRSIIAAFDRADIPALVLKGAALANLAYPHPSLRPMSDLDLLVPESQVRRAQDRLATLGFDASWSEAQCTATAIFLRRRSSRTECWSPSKSTTDSRATTSTVSWRTCGQVRGRSSEPVSGKGPLSCTLPLPVSHGICLLAAIEFERPLKA
jgi:hypothetical protein